VCDQPQKASEEQKRFDKGLALSRTPSRTFAAAVYHARQAGLALAAVPSGAIFIAFFFVAEALKFRSLRAAAIPVNSLKPLLRHWLSSGGG